MEIAGDWLREENADDGVILTTSRVPSTWVADILALHKEGADAMAERIALDAENAETIPAAFYERGRLEGVYHALLTEFGARPDPGAVEPMAMPLDEVGYLPRGPPDVLQSIGCMPALAVGEDRRSSGSSGPTMPWFDMPLRSSLSLPVASTVVCLAAQPIP